VRVTHTKVNEREPIKLSLHKRQVTKIEKYENEIKYVRPIYPETTSSKSSKITVFNSSREN